MLKRSPPKLSRTEIEESQRWGAGGPSRCFERPRDNGRERRRYHLQVSFKHTLIPQNLFFTRTQWVRRGGGASLLKFWMNKESCTSPSSRSRRGSGDGQETQRRPCKLTDGRGTDPHPTQRPAVHSGSAPTWTEDKRTFKLGQPFISTEMSSKFIFIASTLPIKMCFPLKINTVLQIISHLELNCEENIRAVP